MDLFNDDDDSVTIVQGGDVFETQDVQGDVSADATARSDNPDVKDRRGYLGGSDAACLVDRGFKTPFALWMEKTGKSEPDDLSDNERVYWGNQLEDLVAREYMKRTGERVRRVNRAIFHPEYPFIGGHIDRAVVGKRKILECKTTDGMRAKDWENGVPDYYIPQIQHYMGITGAESCDVAVLIGGNRFKFHTVNRDQEIIDFLFQKEIEFWNNHVLADVPPAPKSSEECDEAYKAPTPGTIFADLEAKALVAELAAAKKELAAAKALVEDLEGKVKNLFGNNGDVLQFNDEVLATWKMSERTSLDQKAFEKDHPGMLDAYRKTNTYRQLRLKGEK